MGGSIGIAHAAAWSNQVHVVLKSDLAGAQMPSGPLGANAARCKRRPAGDATLAHNLNAVLKKLVPGWRWLARNMTVPPSTRRAQEQVPRAARTENPLRPRSRHAGDRTKITAAKGFIGESEATDCLTLRRV